MPDGRPLISRSVGQVSVALVGTSKSPTRVQLWWVPWQQHEGNREFPIGSRHIVRAVAVGFGLGSLDLGGPDPAPEDSAPRNGRPVKSWAWESPRLVGWLAGVVCLFVVWQVGRLLGCWVAWLLGCLVAWLLGCLLGLLVSCLLGCLASCCLWLVGACHR